MREWIFVMPTRKPKWKCVSDGVYTWASLDLKLCLAAFANEWHLHYEILGMGSHVMVLNEVILDRAKGEAINYFRKRFRMVVDENGMVVV